MYVRIPNKKEKKKINDLTNLKGWVGFDWKPCIGSGSQRDQLQFLVGVKSFPT